MNTPAIGASVAAAIESPSSGSAFTKAAGAGGNLGKSEFLKLFMAQLNNQDPMNPMENEAFIAQLAQFSSLEQVMETNDRLGMLAQAQNAMNNAQTADLVGRNIEFPSDALLQSGGSNSGIHFAIGSDSSSVSVQIKDAAGKVVRTMALGSYSQGNHRVGWDGLDDNGVAMPDGDYTVSVEALDADGNAVTHTTIGSGIVTGVSFESGAAELVIGDKRVKPADVRRLDRV